MSKEPLPEEETRMSEMPGTPRSAVLALNLKLTSGYELWYEVKVMDKLLQHTGH